MEVKVRQAPSLNQRYQFSSECAMVIHPFLKKIDKTISGAPPQREPQQGDGAYRQVKSQYSTILNPIL